MKTPMRRGAAISQRRMAEWDGHFRHYRIPPDAAAVDAWLARFGQRHRDIAARVLDAVEVLRETQIQRGYKDRLASLPGWSGTAAKRQGRWFFVGFGRAGESGLAMARTFREATRMSSDRFGHLFCSAAELPSKQLTASDTVVFIDDFSGTGNQVCSAWPVIEELLACEARCFLILTAATSEALTRIAECSPLIVLASVTIEEGDNIFSNACRHFSRKEKAALLRYCSTADRKNPRGFGECGLLYVLSHKTPNNTIPVLHANNRRWVGLFPRYLNP